MDGSRSVGSAGRVKSRSGRADQLPPAAWPARPVTMGLGTEDQAADLEKLPGVLLAIGAEPFRRPRERDRERLVADGPGDRDGRDALHAVAIDPGEARGARLRDLASDRLDVDGAADARSLRGEQLHGVLLGQRREQGAPQRREVDGDARPGGLDVAQRVAAFLDARHVYLAPVER